MRLVRLDFTHAVRWTVFTTRRGVASGGGGLRVQPPIRIEAIFFTAVKLLLLNIIISITTRRTINVHDLRKTNHLAGSVSNIWLSVTLQNEPFCALLFIFNQ